MQCIKEGRLPWFVQKRLDKNKIILGQYALRFRLLTFCYNLVHPYKPSAKKQKSLYVSAVGKDGKEFLAKIVKKFGNEDFDYLIFVYDGTDLSEAIFRPCRIIHEKGKKIQFMRKYLTSECCKPYEFIFIWDDDIDIGNFSYKNFIEVMRKNNLEFGQPALSPDSFYSLKITLRDPRFRVGRYTDFVEVMVMVFRGDAWPKFRRMIMTNDRPSGWGYDLLAKAVCRYVNMGIVDSETITHTRLVRSQNTTAPEDRRNLLKQYKYYKAAKQIVYAELK